MLPFEIAGGSVVGRDHVAILKNNQDAFAIFDGKADKEDVLIGVVCDGCGSGHHSEVGAQLAARTLTSSLHRWLSFSKFPCGNQFSLLVKAEVLEVIKFCARSLQGNRPVLNAAIIEHYFLFTTLIVVVRKDVTWIMSMGDGVYSVNGEPTILQPRAGNAPVYLAYNLVKTTLKDEEGALDFQLKEYKTDEIESIIIGSDGCERIIQNQTKLLPGNPNEYVGSLEQFTQPKMFENPDNIRRRLALINKTGQRVNWTDQVIDKYHGLLNDDTTLVTIRRKPVEVTEIPINHG